MHFITHYAKIIFISAKIKRNSDDDLFVGFYFKLSDLVSTDKLLRCVGVRMRVRKKKEQKREREATQRVRVIKRGRKKGNRRRRKREREREREREGGRDRK